jgi:REP element-mobilizing transposase RayT
MPRPRKLIWNDTVLFITTSVEEGLPFAPNPVIKTIIHSALARAQTLHPVRICHLLIQANHLHMIVAVTNPDDVKGFMERFKTESAHAINRLLGKQKHTIWCEGYDSPVLLTQTDVENKIAYLYINPVKDGLVETAKDFPGISTLETLKHGTIKYPCPRIRRWQVPVLPSPSLSLKAWNSINNSLIRNSKDFQQLTITPNAWMECFEITDPTEQKNINLRLLSRISEQEHDYAKKRLEEKTAVLGRDKLILRSIDTHYISSREGKRMWCICHDKSLRVNFINAVKELIKEAKQVYKRWKTGDRYAVYPFGLYAPALPKTVNLYTPAICCW